MLWKNLFLSETICCVPPLVIQFVYQSHIGNVFTSMSMSGELLIFMNGFGFDYVINSADKLPDKSIIQQTLCLAPAILFMFITWGINAVSMYINCSLSFEHVM